MVRGLWGKKIGMTQVFSDDHVVPVTVIDTAGWFITNIKTRERDGYSAVQVGNVKKRYIDKAFSKDWLKKPKEYFTFLKEIRLTDEPQDIAVGQLVNPHVLLQEGEKVDVFGKTKGLGFAGVVRRYNFGGPPGSHGSTMGKRPGSIGFMRSQGKVIKGKKMPGHMGNRRRVMQGLEVIRIDKESGAIAVKGSIPGKSGSLIFVRKA